MNIGILAAPTLEGFRVRTMLPVLADPDFRVTFALVDNRPPAGMGTKLRKNLRRGRGGYVLVMALRRLLARPEAAVSTEGFCREHGIECATTELPNGAAAAELVRSKKLDALVLLGGFGIVRKRILDATPRGVVSYHHGNMRRYRGMPPALWELYHGEREMGVTVQLLSPGLDDGTPIVERTVTIRPSDTVGRLTERALRESEYMLHEALRKLADPATELESITEFGPVYTLPNLRQWLVLNGRIGWRRAGALLKFNRLGNSREVPGRAAAGPGQAPDRRRSAQHRADSEPGRDRPRPLAGDTP
ncbi:MAG: formyltransferase family protein [Saprospiraceae bacterium]